MPSRQRNRVPSGFVPRRLAEARQVRGMTITRLAEISGLHKQTISKYECGLQDPREENLSTLACKLNFPVSYFFKPIEYEQTSPVHFRSLAKATKTQREEAKARLSWIQNLITLLDEHLEPLTSQITNYGKGRHPTQISDEEIVEIAAQVRRDFGLGNGPISNMTWLLQNQGIHVIRFRDLDIEELDAYSVWLREETLPVIILSARASSLCRDRMNLAHELGHLVLHRGIDPEKKEILTIMERQAFLFGSAFLLPAQSYLKGFSYPSLDAFLALKPIWKVSIKAQIERCYRLDVIGEERRRLMYIQYNRRGWSGREPLDAEMPTDEPTYIKESLELLCREGVLDGPSIKDAMALFENDLASFSGLESDFFLGIIKSSAPRPQLRVIKKAAI